MKQFVAIYFLLGIVSGCVAIPDSRLVDQIQGNIAGDRYTPPHRCFSVTVPHKTGSYELAHMHVKEQWFEHAHYISFGPAGFDQSIYRVEFVHRADASEPRVSIEEGGPAAMANYVAELERAYGTSARQLARREEHINGRKALYWELSQTIPSSKNPLSTKDVTVTHQIYLFDLGAAVVMAASQIPSTNQRPAMTTRAFAESVTLY